MSTPRPVDSLATSLAALESLTDQIVQIKSLRFPNYRNLEPNCTLPFEFPITVLLGRNGANKSSILHALYGSVLQGSIADFWFETSLDAIPETVDGLKQSVAHTYVNSDGIQVESIKARAPRGKADPDYWEATKPTMRYGFPRGSTRVPPISLNVVHLDFRAELPAFDKYFYFPDPSHLARRARYARNRATLRREYRKQDYLRRRSGLVRKRMDESAEALSDLEIGILRYVLERDYVAGTILTHDIFHGHFGRTIRFTTSDFAGGYSDAFAGSGESAAAFLVHDILGADNGSLILLDEPETSLHPRAQRRMLEFLCHFAVRKQLQIVMATHSAVMSEALPQKAIRLLELKEAGRVHISTLHSAREALYEIDTLPPGRVALVEDNRAKHLLLSALDSVSPQARQEIVVEVRPGGTSQIFRDLQAFASAGRADVHVVLDGDHKPAEPFPNPGSLPQGRDELIALVSAYTKGRNATGPRLAFDSPAAATLYIEALRSNVRFLPSSNPEELVWSDEAAMRAVGLTSLPLNVLAEHSFKEKLRKTSSLRPGLSEDSLYEILVAQFLESESPEKSELVTLVNALRNA